MDGLMAYVLKDKTTLYAGTRVNLELHRYEDETSSQQLKREVVVHPGSVVILPFASGAQQPTRNDSVLLIRNMRYGLNKYLLELPAGTLEKGESPMNCAGRELQEETGYLARKLTSIGAFYSSPGVMTEKLYAFAAYDLTLTQTSPDAGEDIEVCPTRYLDAIEMIKHGEIEDAKTIATLLMYALLFKH
jgi:ADP-ribose pyrophosphatase